eukprot:TRINITY_DN5303_c0_g1_i2.p1 TRINITY_DN5303_c0_g1~~TRINITY_DN5303_c0_g1_i2.p1  ORF type:complete len:234 (+),score=60.72 TRINITY_DN5303_c0_g1_i2:60-704(+)
MPPETRRDLEATNAAILEVAARKEEREIEVEITASGVYAIDQAGVVIMDSNINNVLLAGSRGTSLVVLTRNSVSGDRSQGSHNVHLCQAEVEEEASEMRDLLNRFCRMFLTQVKAAKEKRGSMQQSMQQSPGQKTALAAQALRKASTQSFKPYSPSKDDRDEFEQMAFTGYEYEAPTSSRGRPSVAVEGGIYELNKASRRVTSAYQPKPLYKDE